MKSATNKLDSKEGLYIQEFPSAIEAFEIEQGINKPEAWPLCIEISKRYNERKALLNSHRELLQVMELVNKKFEQWPIGNQTWDKVRTAIDNAKKIIP